MPAAGAVYVYTKSGFSWTLQARVTSPTPVANERFGYDAAVGGDTLVAGMLGAFAGSLVGEAYVFVRSGTWRPTFPVMIEFPDLAKAHEWYASDAYRELKAMRLSAVRSNAVFFEGL